MCLNKQKNYYICILKFLQKTENIYELEKKHN